MIDRLAKKANMRLSPGKLYFGPDWIILGVNNICNLHCKMCDVGTGYSESNFHHHLTGARPLNMPPELIYRIFDQTAKYYPKAKIGYAFTEPIIYPHLVDSVAYATKKGLYTSMTTNGLFLGKKADELSDAGLKEVFVSLDGPPDVHNEIRGNRQSFERAMEGMEKILAMPKPRPDVAVYCTLTEFNIGRLHEFLDLLRHLPLREVGFLHTNYTPEWLSEAHNKRFGDRYPATSSNLDGIDLEKMDLDRLWEELESLRTASYPFPLRYAPYLPDREALERFYRDPGTLIGKVCNDAFRTLMIKSDGTAIPAHGRCYRVTAGNIYDTDLKSLWNAPALAQFRKTLMREGGLLPACSRCCSAF